MIRKIFFASAIVVAISGCTAMDKLAGMGVVSQQTSTFDNSTVIDVSPNSLYDPNSTWWIGPYISIHFLSLNPLLVRRRRYSRGERYPSSLSGLSV